MQKGSIGYGHKCKECAYYSRTTRVGRHSGWCERPGQVLYLEDVSPNTAACNMFKSK